MFVSIEDQSKPDKKNIDRRKFVELDDFVRNDTMYPHDGEMTNDHNVSEQFQRISKHNHTT